MNPFKTKEDMVDFLRHHVLTTTEACEILGISRQAIHQAVASKKLPVLKSGGSVTLFLREDVEAYKNQRSK